MIIQSQISKSNLHFPGTGWQIGRRMTLHFPGGAGWQIGRRMACFTVQKSLEMLLRCLYAVDSSSSDKFLTSLLVQGKGLRTPIHFAFEHGVARYVHSDLEKKGQRRVSSSAPTLRSAPRGRSSARARGADPHLTS
jgi:hypothetical protein